MLSLQNPHPRDQDISFKEEGHTYIIKGDRFYKSCTTWLKTFFEKFDADRTIDRMMASPKWPQSPYFGKTREEIKAGWSQKGEKAASYGTDLHAIIEDYYNGNPRTSDAPEFEYFQDFLRDHSHLVPYRTEMMIYDEDVRICGSVDMIYKNDDGTFSIYDWKFSSKLDYYSAFGKKALAPISHLDDCNYIHYSLQLNIYRTILERKYGFQIKELFLIFMHRDLSPSYIKVPVQMMDMTEVFNTRLGNN
jgi:hypothetical protein